MSKQIANIQINAKWCKGCGVCVEFCPKSVFELNQFQKAEAVRAEACIACKMCEMRCPDFAIVVKKSTTD